MPEGPGESTYCHRCGSLLYGDHDEETTGGIDGLPLCGDCARNRDDAADMEVADLADGNIDGQIEW